MKQHNCGEIKREDGKTLFFFSSCYCVGMTREGNKNLEQQMTSSFVIYSLRNAIKNNQRNVYKHPCALVSRYK
jgi:hypothetical protein